MDETLTSRRFESHASGLSPSGTGEPGCEHNQYLIDFHQPLNRGGVSRFLAKTDGKTLMSGPTWMAFYPADYVADTMHLTRDQHGAYFLLIIAYWRNGGPLPDDDEQLAAIAKALPTEWSMLRSAMAKFFKIRRGFWHHKRIDEELTAARTTQSARRAAGLAGAKARWQKHSESTGKRRDARATLPSPSHDSPPNPPAGGALTKNRKGRGNGAQPPEIIDPVATPPWQKRCAAWAKSGFWLPTWGPKPDEPNCLAPAEFRVSNAERGKR